MLGIIFTGGKGPPEEKIRALLNTEAKGALIAAADSGLERAEAAGFSPDWIIGDMDSADPARLGAYPADRVLPYPVDKDYTDTELAFKLLHEKGCDDIWIVGGAGGRIDHLFGIRSLLEREIFPKRWFLDTADVYCIEGEALSLRLESGALVSVFPMAGGPWQASSGGLKWPLDNVVWDRGFSGLSNVAQTDECSIQAKQGRFMVLIPYPEQNQELYGSDHY
jgi:thiamine pyrophosphokinase